MFTFIGKLIKGAIYTTIGIVGIVVVVALFTGSDEPKKVAKVEAYQTTEEERHDLKCIAKLSIARDGLINSGHTYDNSRALDKLTTLQDKLFIKYEIGHPHINTKKMDQVKKVYLSSGWEFLYATDESAGMGAYSVIFDDCGASAGIEKKW